jgi:structural maintenance of chromosome 2
MHIKEVIIDGFKSYANRTVVSGFDPHFNAITGLNGSGKSNILDSICFVLGISNLTQVRAQNLRDLVYKQGQAHVTKASVSIVFDNCNKQQSPIGYHSADEITVTREVVVGGKNKYMINGTTVTQQTVQNLFHSVQLNVNNPHFLIMQGRITKVLNMKPPEILAMIEEAAGTRMFEMKKQSALRTIEKKQHKVDEINKVLSEEITPQLEKLRKECLAFNQYQSNEIEIERLERYVIAAVYFEAEASLKKIDKDFVEFKKESNDLIESIEEHDAQIKVLSKQIDKMTKSRMADQEGDYSKLEEKVSSISKDMVKYSSVVENVEQLIKVEQDSLMELKQQRSEFEQSISEKKGELTSLTSNLEEAESKHEALVATKASLEGQQLGFNMGGNQGNDKGSLVQQQMAANTLKSSLESKKKSLELQLENVKSERVSKKNHLKLLEKEFAEIRKHSVGLERDQSKLEQRIGVSD